MPMSCYFKKNWIYITLKNYLYIDISNPKNTLNKLKGERFCSKKSIHDDIYNINNNNNSYYDGRFNTIDKYESNIFYEENNLTNLIRNFSV
jgi:hypothetical protein